MYIIAFTLKKNIVKKLAYYLDNQREKSSLGREFRREEYAQWFHSREPSAGVYIHPYREQNKKENIMYQREVSGLHFIVRSSPHQIIGSSLRVRDNRLLRLSCYLWFYLRNVTPLSVLFSKET